MKYLSQIYPTYDWVDNDGNNNLVYEVTCDAADDTVDSTDLNIVIIS